MSIADKFTSKVVAAMLGGIEFLERFAERNGMLPEKQLMELSHLSARIKMVTERCRRNLQADRKLHL